MSATGGCEVLWAVPIVVALIGGPLMWFLHRFDRRNSEQHNHNFEVLERIEDKIDKVDERLHEHISWHLGRSKKKGAA